MSAQAECAVLGRAIVDGPKDPEQLLEIKGAEQGESPFLPGERDDSPSWSSEDEAGGEDLAAWLASIGGDGSESFLADGDGYGGVFGVVPDLPSDASFGDSGQESAG